MLSKFTVFTGLKQAKFCQTGCFGIGAVAYVIPQVPRGVTPGHLGEVNVFQHDVSRLKISHAPFYSLCLK